MWPNQGRHALVRTGSPPYRCGHGWPGTAKQWPRLAPAVAWRAGRRLGAGVGRSSTFITGPLLVKVRLRFRAAQDRPRNAAADQVNAAGARGAAREMRAALALTGTDTRYVPRIPHGVPLDERHMPSS